MTALDGLALGAVTLAGGIVQGATGFGFALLVLAFYLAILDSAAAVQLTVLLSLAISLAVAPRVWRHAEPGRLLRLGLGSLAGFPIGFAAYALAGLATLKLAVALLVLGFALYLLLGRRGGPALRGNAAAEIGVGAVSGAMTVALAMPGPAAILYLAATGADKQATRATLLTLFVLSYTAALLVHIGLVGIPTQIWTALAALLPLALLGAWAGHRLAGHLDEALFRRLILLLLVAGAAYAAWSAVAA